MRVTVEGVVTSVAKKVKDNKISTELLLVQKGEKEQVTVRLEGDVADQFEEFEKQSFSGRLMTWVSRDRVGSMVMVGE